MHFPCTLPPSSPAEASSSINDVPSIQHIYNYSWVKWHPRFFPPPKSQVNHFLLPHFLHHKLLLFRNQCNGNLNLVIQAVCFLRCYLNFYAIYHSLLYRQHFILQSRNNFCPPEETKAQQTEKKTTAATSFPSISTESYRARPRKWNHYPSKTSIYLLFSMVCLDTAIY